MWSFLGFFFSDESAISSVEYAMLLALIGLVTVASMLALGEQIATRMETAATTIQAQ